MAGWPGGFERWLRPHPSIEDPGGQRRARLAAGLLLLLLPLLVLAFLFPDEGDGPALSGHRLTLLALLGIVASYALVHTGRAVLGTLLAIATIEAALAVSVANADDHTTAVLALGFFVVPIAMAGLLLPVGSAAAVAGVTLVLAMMLEARVDGHTDGFLPDQHAWTLALQLLAVSVLSVASATMAGRQAKDLEESQKLMLQLAESIPEVFFVVSGDGRRMLYMSPAYPVVMGRSVAQAMADPLDWLKAVHPDDLPAVQQALAQGKPDIEYRVVHPSGDVKHLQARTFPIPGPGGTVERLVGIAEDVTAERRAQHALEEAQRQRIHLLQQLAHDLASPLSPVKIQLRMLRDRLPKEDHNALGIVQRNVDHIQRLVEDVKDVARLEGGDLRLDRRPADLSELARHAVESLAPAAAERGVTLGVEAPAPLPARVDPGRLTQVLYNLVGNALKFTPAGGRIGVRVRRVGDDAEVAVDDSGRGMRPEQLQRLFQPFSQVHEPGSLQRPEDRGTGLGLYISKGIVEAHGGAIRAESAGPGLGSTFTFRVPVGAPGPS